MSTVSSESLECSPTLKPSQDYRRDIDGLRAIAVMLVVLYHFDVEILSGGFVGVDVFFVISGFLITRIIVSALHDNSFVFRTFWIRRIRRLLPASLTMILVVLIAFSAIYPATLYQDIGKSSIAQLLFSSNMYFWSGSGYFQTDSELKPLLHTWSLSVEEQYYFLYPFILYTVFRLNRHWLLRTTVLISLASYVFSILIYENESSGAFFWLPARAWELGIGGCLAMLYKNHYPLTLKPLTTFASLTGVTLILYSAVSFNELTPFPYHSALLPVLGTALTIWGNGEQDNPVRKLLQTSPMVFIGLISYSLYLWHWPIKVGASWYSIPLKELDNLLLILSGTITLSWLSYRYIEKPFRSVKS